MSALQAARMGDDVGAHSGALGGLIAGALLGLAVGVLLGAFLVATVATGGAALAIAGASMVAIGGAISLAAAVGKLGKSFGAHFTTGSPCSKVTAGSPDTWIEDQRAARAEQDRADHGRPEPIAQGSSTVLVNDRRLARDTDGAGCGGRLISHCKNVWVGGASGGTPCSEVPSWASDDDLDRIALAGGGLALGGSVLTFGAVATVVLGSLGFLGAKAGHFAGAFIGRQVDARAGYSDRRFEQLGAGLGEVSAGLAAGFGRPGRWQMNASARVSEAIAHNRVTGSTLDRPFLTRGADAPSLRALTAGADPVVRERILREAADDPRMQAQLQRLHDEGYKLRWDAAETGTYANPATREIVVGRDAPLEAIVKTPRHEPGELYALKKDGFGWDAENGLSSGSREYGQKMHESVQDVGARVKSGELRTAREAMDALAEHRRRIAEESGDEDAYHFGVRRDTPRLIDARALTPLEGWKYEYAMKRAVPADGTDRPPWVEYIDGEWVDLTSVVRTRDYGWAWIHSPGRSIAPVMRRVEILYGTALDPRTSVADTTAAVGELHYLLAHAMPYARGSASITDGLTKMIFQARGFVVSPWKEGIVPDIEALVSTDLPGFVEGYGAMMVLPPRQPACATCGAAAAVPSARQLASEALPGSVEARVPARARSQPSSGWRRTSGRSTFAEAWTRDPPP